LRYLAVAFKKQWRRYRKELKKCQKKFSPSRVHESRVATRRLLSMTELLGPFLAAGRVKKAQTALKHHLDCFDDLRDTQVQLPAVRKLACDYPTAKRFHEYLCKQEKRFTARTRKRVKRIKTGRLARLIASARADLEAWRKENAPALANNLLLQTVNAAFARTRQLQDRIDPKDTATIHCTRVAFKRFRYMLEMLAQHLPLAGEKRLEAMHRYQSLMGDIQDAQVLLQTFDCFAQKKDLAPGAGHRFRNELLRRRRALIRNYLAAAGDLERFWPDPETLLANQPAAQLGHGIRAPAHKVEQLL
jgi:CHAD domain-containing protein